MKIDMFCEVERAKPWPAGYSEHQLLKETLTQAQFADAAGFDAWWEVEHHTAVEMSYSSAPEVMLSAISQRTKRMRIGHSAVLSPHGFSHPIRIAERAATLDLISDGRLELGFARSTIPEWRVFGIDPDETRAQLQETMEMVPKIWAAERFSWQSKNYNIVERPIIPKPLQKPHPPLWQAGSSPDSFLQAAHNGCGVLGVTLLTNINVMADLLKTYREEVRQAEPVGAFVNNQTAVFTFVHCAETTKQALENGAAAAAAWYANTTVHFFELEQRLLAREQGQGPEHDPAGLAMRGELATPGAKRSRGMELVSRLAHGEDISPEEAFEVFNEEDSVIIGDPETCRKKMEHYRDIGVDRLMCFQQVGGLSHEKVMDSIRLVGQHLIPVFSPK